MWTKINRNKRLVFSLIVFGLAVSARLIPGARIIDDAFISFRYARNILSGSGFVYNLNEQVLGTTTPLYTLLLVLVGSVTGGSHAPFPAIALIVNALADGLTAVLLLRLGRILQHLWAGVGAALIWTVLPYSVTFAIGGMETSIYVLFLVSVWIAYSEQRYPVCAILGAGALLTRPDAIILLVPIACDRLLFDTKRRGVPLKSSEFVAFFVPIILWFGFATAYFGSPLPHSMIAKQGAYLLEPSSAFIRLLQHYATPFMGHLTFGNLWNGIGLIVYFFFFSIVCLQILRNQTAHWAFLLFPWLYFAVFAVANPLIFRWYLTPPLPFYILIIFTGLMKFARDLFKIEPGTTEKQTRGYQVAVLLMTILPLILILRSWDWRPDHGPKRPAPTMAWHLLELYYQEAAEIVSQDVGDPGLAPTLAAGDVGVLGYSTGLPILDTVGLNSPQTLDYYPLEPELIAGAAYAVAPDLIFDEMPEYIVILEIYGRAGLLRDLRFAQQYKLLQKLETDIYESDGLLIFKHQP